MFQGKSAHFKGKSEIGLVNHPLERPVFPSLLQKELRVINSHLRLYL